MVTGAGNLTGTTQEGAGAYGTVPTVPNPVNTSGQAVAGNLTNLPGLFDLANQTNLFNIGQAAAPYIANMPDYLNLIGKRSADIGAELSGTIPQDVWNQLAQRAAERGTSMGSPLSPNADAALMAALGTNSLEQIQKGMANLATAYQTTPVPQLWYPQNFFVTPEQQQQAQYSANVMAAAPNPEEAAQEAQDLARQGVQSGLRNVGGMGGISGPVGAPSSPFTAPGATRPAVGVSSGAPGYNQAPITGSLSGLVNATWPQTSGSGSWYWDPVQGGYVNQSTGEISDTAGGQPWGNLNYSNAPAVEGLGGTLPTGAPAWTWDNDVGAYVNTSTGDISDTPGGQTWGNVSDAAEGPGSAIDEGGYQEWDPDSGSYWEWDDAVEGYVNTETGDISDSASYDDSWGVNYDDLFYEAGSDTGGYAYEDWDYYE